MFGSAALEGHVFFFFIKKVRMCSELPVHLLSGGF